MHFRSLPSFQSASYICFGASTKSHLNDVAWERTKIKQTCLNPRDIGKEKLLRQHNNNSTSTVDGHYRDPVVDNITLASFSFHPSLPSWPSDTTKKKLFFTFFHLSTCWNFLSTSFPQLLHSRCASFLPSLSFPKAFWGIQPFILVSSTPWTSLGAGFHLPHPACWYTML